MDRRIAWVFFILAALAFAFQEIKIHQRESTRAPTSEHRVLKSCLARDLNFRWPLDGKDGTDWLIANYNDLDPRRGSVRDYMGNTASQAVTYDGHDGIDIDVASFRVADRGVAVLAAADGVVEEVFDESTDRNFTCSKDKWNFVRVRHGNGFASVYGHLRRKSAVVAAGQRVTTGQKLGLVGSSGCSSHPHLHFETWNCVGQVIDAVEEKFFTSMPAYSRMQSASVMETALFQPAINAIVSIQDPGPEDAETVKIGTPFSVAITLAHIVKGDEIKMEFYTPSGSRADLNFRTIADRDYLRSHWWGDFTLEDPGTWRVVFKVNDRAHSERQLIVR